MLHFPGLVHIPAFVTTPNHCLHPSRGRSLPTGSRKLSLSLFFMHETFTLIPHSFTGLFVVAAASMASTHSLFPIHSYIHSAPAWLAGPTILHSLNQRAGRIRMMMITMLLLLFDVRRYR
ncbi:hypothetical protein EJ05DRAFT_340890 [Pseudovirgaria hyperparasitica]|uniref:Uncharacterized protein n=1 Tax=Pseudovirgaria hyperparasitica TaxID=470096 RepID=A0A6A6WBF4_9PEZI|nr:uncharacterized protein EJ05DRAFT_340890 [Pseudovirgaria hyperparasitica]KAF2759290.1 hypothetical protein EJ05DRAFT_340890 [Pseudovirgaria hyperparasitica]